MRVLLIELAIIVVIFVILRLLRSRIRFFRGGYVRRIDSYMQDDRMRMLVEDTHFFRGKERENRSLRVDETNLVYSRIPLDPENKVLMVYSYCAPILGMLKGSGTPIDRTLVLGGGGGAVPLYILQSYPDAKADVVEINAESIRISREHFLKAYASGADARANLIQGDAKQAVADLAPGYAFIFCDLYIGGEQVDFVFDERFLADVSRLCGEDGVLVINGSSLSILGVRLLLLNLKEAFTHAWAMLLSDGFVLIARNREMPALDGLLQSANGGIVPIYPSIITDEILAAMAEAKKAAR